MKNLTDAELVMLACEKSGMSSQAFAELYSRYQGKLKAYILSLTSYDRSIADDILQITFESAWSRIHQLKNPNQFFQWTVTIARNKTYDFVKSIKVVEQIEDWMTEDFVDNSFNIEYQNDLEKMLVSLSKEEREVTVMKAVLGFSFDEIAEQLSLSLSATKMRYYRALEKMKKSTKTV